ncbi:NAC domain [Arabidopsis suecica]|uniref:NAC domain n=1 Tax=Arabidopsis suecica TaxID=45249 RepID=A0A8T2H212_ARASU|nr:NAC domain [Arabidopsis suecica]
MKSFPVGSRFLPEDLGLVRFYLRNMVERKQSSFITTMDVYDDEPWLLPHVNNPLFKNKVWYYFVPLTKRGSSVQRMVPGRGGSEGGTWRSNDGKKEIKDGHERVMGYQQSFTYHRKVHGVLVKTDWLMQEYSLHKSDEHQKLVLCRIRYKKQKNVNKIRRVNHQAHQTQVAENTNNILQSQSVQEEVDLTDFPDELETMLEGQEDREEQEEVDLTDFPDELETMLEGQEDYEQQQEAELTGFSDDPESMLLDGEEDRDVTQQQQQQQQEEEIPVPTPMQNNDNNNNVVMMMSNQQVQEEAAGLIGLADDFAMTLLEGQEDRDVTEQQQQQQEEDGMMVLMDNPNDALALGNYEFIDLTRVDERSDTIQRKETY